MNSEIPAPEIGESRPPPFPFFTVVWVLLGVLSCLALALFLLWKSHAAPFGSAAPVAAPEVHADEARLKRYGWADRETEAVHIPVDRAAEIWLREEGKR